MKSVKQYLVDFVQSTPIRSRGDIIFQHFVLANGTEHVRHPDPHRYFKRHKTIGHCFKNAFLLVSEFRNELLYTEGYALNNNSPTPVLHAWAMTAKGECVDPTWPGGVEYFGVPFDFEYVTRIAFGAEVFSGVIDNGHDQHPLLSGVHTDWRPKGKMISNQPSP